MSVDDLCQETLSVVSIFEQLQPNLITEYLMPKQNYKGDSKLTKALLNPLPNIETAIQRIGQFIKDSISEDVQSASLLTQLTIYGINQLQQQQITSAEPDRFKTTFLFRVMPSMDLMQKLKVPQFVSVYEGRVAKDQPKLLHQLLFGETYRFCNYTGHPFHYLMQFMRSTDTNDIADVGKKLRAMGLTKMDDVNLEYSEE